MNKLKQLFFLFASLLELAYRERRLPGRLTENLFIQAPSYIKIWIFNKFKLVDLEESAFVHLPHLRHRYAFQVLHLLSLAYPNVIFLWDFNPKNYIALGQDGRRLFSLKNLKIMPVSSKLKTQFIFESPQLLLTQNPKDRQSQLTALIQPDVSEEPQDNSLLIPYGVHPSFLQNFRDFNSVIPKLRNQKRYVRVFFAGNIGFPKDKHLVERYYGIPSRLRCADFLVEQADQLNILVIRTFNERRYFANYPETFQKYSLVLALTKGESKKWLNELAMAAFFLALPGAHMPMCHNVIESMAVGTIPILSYDNYFSPALEHGKNCLIYRDLEDLSASIKMASQMDSETIRQMRAAVIEYYERFLNPSKVATCIRNYQGSKLHLYINHEDAETLRKVTDKSVLSRGGDLQHLL